MGRRGGGEGTARGRRWGGEGTAMGRRGGDKGDGDRTTCRKERQIGNSYQQHAATLPARGRRGPCIRGEGELEGGRALLLVPPSPAAAVPFDAAPSGSVRFGGDHPSSVPRCRSLATNQDLRKALVYLQVKLNEAMIIYLEDQSR
ncbi:uncharacterized protein LOC119350399 [Triticum dicoccoides]|uniref:uncharacterized protein LOC119350399 n=1 Tax=Triticum dicoccoides TaxID=85692 RepID=UPI00188E0597|nr:uncharacterized protein LOC119350399 [Triticum dicoccoides]